jgi:hypothetical protein
MRAVLRAALAARRSARPTDALSGEGTIFLDFDFTVLAESVGRLVRVIIRRPLIG